VPIFPEVNSNNIGLQFFSEPLPAHFKPTYSLVIPVHERQIFLCNITNRGWCIPSGKIEPDELPLEAAIRETHEEAFITLEKINHLGYYKLTTSDSIKYAVLFVAKVASILPVQPNDEVSDRMLVSLEELPGLYNEWNPLLASVFDYAIQFHSSNQ